MNNAAVVTDGLCEQGEHEKDKDIEEKERKSNWSRSTPRRTKLY